jgi:hypothetical protein
LIFHFSRARVEKKEVFMMRRDGKYFGEDEIERLLGKPIEVLREVGILSEGEKGILSRGLKKSGGEDEYLIVVTTASPAKESALNKIEFRECLSNPLLEPPLGDLDAFPESLESFLR